MARVLSEGSALAAPPTEPARSFGMTRDGLLQWLEKDEPAKFLSVYA
jgi:hypothetical protein